jgi:hypothetical protein
MSKSKSRKKKAPKRVRPPISNSQYGDAEILTSANGQRICEEATRTRRLPVLRHASCSIAPSSCGIESQLEQRQYVPATINLRPVALRRVAYEPPMPYS